MGLILQIKRYSDAHHTSHTISIFQIKLLHLFIVKLVLVKFFYSEAFSDEVNMCIKIVH